jgi:hypothetical protein
MRNLLQCFRREELKWIAHRGLHFEEPAHSPSLPDTSVSPEAGFTSRATILLTLMGYLEFSINLLSVLRPECPGSLASLYSCRLGRVLSAIGDSRMLDIFLGRVCTRAGGRPNTPEHTDISCGRPTSSPNDRPFIWSIWRFTAQRNKEQG